MSAGHLTPSISYAELRDFGPWRYLRTRPSLATRCCFLVEESGHHKRRADACRTCRCVPDEGVGNEAQAQVLAATGCRRPEGDG